MKHINNRTKSSRKIPLILKILIHKNLNAFVIHFK
jgi:hypothetical protein